MKKKLQRILALALVASMTASTPGMAAGWVDDWLAQKTVNSPDYFAGQKRGYYSGGSFSARWPNTADYPVTIEMPRLKSGCGGIDMFLGGFSFLNFEYLVQKLQRLLMAAPAVAFDIALKILCESCASTIKSLDALANQLNSMQLDECSVAQGVRTILDDGKGGFASMDTISSRLSTAIKENKLSQGISDLYQSITESDRSNQGKPQQADVERSVSGCNADIRQIFLSDMAPGGTSLLANLGVTKMGMPQSYVDLIRGLVGDIHVAASDKAFLVSYIPGCEQNSPGDVKAFTDGQVQAKSAAGACYQITDANRDLESRIAGTMISVANKIKGKGTPTTTEMEFIQNSPLNIGLVLRQAVSTEMESATIGSMSEMTAKAYVMLMLEDLYGRAAMTMFKAREVLSKKAVAAAGQDAENCQAIIFGDNLDREIKGMLAALGDLRNAARQSYMTSATEANTILSYLQHMKRTDAKVQAEVERRMGKGTAKYLAGAEVN